MRDPTSSPPASPAAAAPAASAGVGARRAVPATASPASFAFVDGAVAGRVRRLRRGHGRASRGSSRCARPGRRRARGPWRRSSSSSRTACSRCRPTSRRLRVDVGRSLPGPGRQDGLAARAALEHEPARDARRGGADRDGRALRLARGVLDRVDDRRCCRRGRCLGRAARSSGSRPLLVARAPLRVRRFFAAGRFVAAGCACASPVAWLRGTRPFRAARPGLLSAISRPSLVSRRRAAPGLPALRPRLDARYAGASGSRAVG